MNDAACPGTPTAASTEPDSRVNDTYQRLRSIARRHLRRYRPGQTLNTTAVVHEAWIRLASGAGPLPVAREEFLKLASTAMRRLIVDYGRRRHAAKRGSGACLLTLTEQEPAVEGSSLLDVVAVDRAISELGRHDPVLEQVVECRFFAGLTMDETALALARPLRTVERDWARARVYLLEALEQR